MAVRDETAGDPRKQPLWEMPPRPRSVGSVLAASLGVVVFLLASAFVVDPRLEEHVLSSPPATVEVEVLRVESGIPPDELPASYRHVVRLPDGTEAQLHSSRLFRPGSKVEGVLTRGRVTKRVRLSAPYRLVAEPD